MAHLRHGERDSVVDAALDAMDAEQLRALIRAVIPWLDHATPARLMNEVVNRAARASSGWSPSTPSERRVEEIEAYVAAARRVHQADPSDVDDYLREGTHAFLARDYAAALRIFQALLIPIGEADIDLGQHEVVNEVLGVDVDACAKQYVAAMYMTASPTNRARAVCSAIEDVPGVGYFFEPLRELERASVEPLPDFDELLVQWRALVGERVAHSEKRDWDRREDRWLREVVSRTQGPDGLADHERVRREHDVVRERLAQRPELLVVPVGVGQDPAEQGFGPHRPAVVLHGVLISAWPRRASRGSSAFGHGRRAGRGGAL